MNESAFCAANEAAETAARTSYAKLLAYLAKRSGRIDAAEDALGDAFALALERWPREGIPRAPQAWLLVAARNRFVDTVRHERRTEHLHDRLVAAARAAQRDFEHTGTVADERLDLMFACAHPAVASHVRAPLILQVVLGLDARRIAAAYLLSPAAMSQRLVRAKQKIAIARIPLEIPPADRWPDRLEAVLAAIYAAFSAGCDAQTEADSSARGFVIEAISLSRIVVAMFPNEPEVLGLLALLLHTHARHRARRSSDHTYIPLDEQDVSLWNIAQIDEAESLLRRAFNGGSIGRYQLEAAIQSAHVVRRFTGSSDWPAIVTLYDELFERTRSPVVAVNRAVAVGHARGAIAGLEALDVDAIDPRMRRYQPYWAARADLLARAGRTRGAQTAYAAALELTVDPSARRHLAKLMNDCAATREVTT